MSDHLGFTKVLTFINQEYVAWAISRGRMWVSTAHVALLCCAGNLLWHGDLSLHLYMAFSLCMCLCIQIFLFVKVSAHYQLAPWQGRIAERKELMVSESNLPFSLIFSLIF